MPHRYSFESSVKDLKKKNKKKHNKVTLCRIETLKRESIDVCVR